MPALKKVLLIAYFYPPFNKVGAVRAAKFAKYLPEFGWEPIVLTRDWDSVGGLPVVSGVQTVRTGYADRLSAFRRGNNSATDADESTPPASPATGGLKTRLRRTAAYWAKEALAYPDEFVGWKPFALEAGRRILREQEISLILCTAKPYSSFAIARQLAAESGLPWVADFRDPWTQGPAYNHSRPRALFERSLESRWLSSARLLTTVSEPWAAGLRALHHKPVTVVANGYDEEDYSGPPQQPTAKFTLTYTGRVYSGTRIDPGYSGERDPGLLFQAVRELLDRGAIDPANFEIRFYGPDREQADIFGQAKAHGIGAVVNHYGLLAYTASLIRQRESSALLLLNWKSAEDTFRQQGWFTAKVYEYMGAGRPILAMPVHKGVEALLCETGAEFSADSPAQIAAILADWYAQFAATGQLPYSGTPQKIRSYTRRSQTKLLAAALNEALEPSVSG